MSEPVPTDASTGYEAIAREFQAAREGGLVGATTIAAWARTLPPGAVVLDVGCGAGVPVAEALTRAGCEVWGIDGSATLLQAFRTRFPQCRAACEDITESSLFDRTFDAVVAVGVLFLLAPELQRRVLHRIAGAVVPGGSLLFTAPAAAGSWTDVLTKRLSVSLGAVEYARVLADAGLVLVGETEDEGANHYFIACKPRVADAPADPTTLQRESRRNVRSGSSARSGASSNGT